MPEVIFIGAIAVDLARHRLALNDREVGIEPRAAQVLALLCEHRGQVVSRGLIFDRVWRGGQVTDDALNRTIFDLRRAFQSLDPRSKPIETVRKGGYRLRHDDHPQPPAARRNALVPVALVLAALAGAWWLLRAAQDAPVTLLASPRALTTDLGLETHPDWSPASGLLAFTCQQQRKVAICGLDPSRPGSTRMLVADPAEGGRWSPDGRTLAYQRVGAECQIRVRRLDNGDDSLVRACRARNDASLAWSPDGQWLYWSDRQSRDGPFAVYRATVGGDSWARVSAPPTGSVGDLFPRLSPKGRYLALFRAATPSSLSTYITPGVGHILVLDLAEPETGPRQLTDRSTTVTGVTWLDGDALLAIHSDEAGFGFWRYRLDGSRELIGRAEGGIARSPAVVGAELVYEAWDAEADLLRIDLESGEFQPVASSTRYDFNPALSPDGSRLALVSTRSGRTRIWLAPLAGDDPPRPLTRFESGAVETPSWSPDGRELAAELRQGGRSRVFVIDAESGSVRWLDLPGNSRVPVFDGDRLLVTSDRTGSWQIWAYDLSDGGSSQLSIDGGFAGRRWTPPDGAGGIVYSRLGAGGLYFQRGDRVERLPLDLAPEHWGNWRIVDDRVIALVTDESGRQVLRSWDGGRLEDLLELPRPMLRESVNFDLTTDGKHLFYSTRTGISANLQARSIGEN